MIISIFIFSRKWILHKRIKTSMARKRVGSSERGKWGERKHRKCMKKRSELAVEKCTVVALSCWLREMGTINMCRHPFRCIINKLFAYWLHLINNLASSAYTITGKTEKRKKRVYMKHARPCEPRIFIYWRAHIRFSRREGSSHIEPESLMLMGWDGSGVAVEREKCNALSEMLFIYLHLQLSHERTSKNSF